MNTTVAWPSLDSTRPANLWPQDFRSNLGWGRLRFKTIFIGESNSGKTQIVRRLLRLGFDASRQSNEDVDNNAVEIEVYLDDMPMRVILDVWDTAGQERYYSLAPAYYNRSFLCLMVYDTTSASSFANLSNWMERYCDPDAVNRPGAGLGPEGEVRNMALIGTKSDLAHFREVPRSRGEQLAQHYDIAFAEISSLNNQGSGEIETILAFLTEQACRAVLCPPNLYLANGWTEAHIPPLDTLPVYRYEQAFELNASAVDYSFTVQHYRAQSKQSSTIHLPRSKKKRQKRKVRELSGDLDTDCACA